jgi:uncharacterized membrane protein
VIAIGPTFAGLAAESFDQIRASASASAKGNVVVILRLLDAIEIIAGFTASAGRRRALREQTEWLAELAARSIESPHDRSRFEERLARVCKALDTEPCFSKTNKPTNP